MLWVMMGCEVIELCFDVDWDKGKMLLWVFDYLLYLGLVFLVLIYFGDDIIDEDVFDVVGFYGVLIVVCYIDDGDCVIVVLFVLDSFVWVVEFIDWLVC